MGGKGSPSGGDNSAMMMMMMQNMMGQQSAEPMMPHMPTMPHMPSTPDPVPVPEIEEIEPYDWTEEASKAAANAEADQLLDQTRRPALTYLEDDELETTDSILAGE